MTSRVYTYAKTRLLSYRTTCLRSADSYLRGDREKGAKKGRGCV